MFISPPVVVVHYESECVVRWQVEENGEGAVYVVCGSGAAGAECYHAFTRFFKVQFVRDSATIRSSSRK